MQFEVWNLGPSRNIPPFDEKGAITLMENTAVYTDDEDFANYLGTFPMVDVNKISKAPSLSPSPEPKPKPAVDTKLENMRMPQLHKLAGKLREGGDPNFWGKTKQFLIDIIKTRSKDTT